MARKPDFDADDPFNPEVVQRQVEDAAKAERVRKTFLGYREQLHKVVESLADSSNTATKWPSWSAAAAAAKASAKAAAAAE